MKWNEPPLPSTQESTTLFHEFLSIEKEALLLPQGQLHSHYTLHISPAAVMVLATTSDGKCVINREYRHSVKRLLLSAPGGTLHKDEDPLEGARRELLEETGYSSDEWHLLGVSYPFPGVCSQVTYFAAAKNARQATAPQRESEEIIDTVEMSKHELREAIKSGIPVDGLLCTTLFWADLKTY